MEDIKSKKINYNLEILRGFAAVVVVFHHIIFHNTFFNPQYFPNILKTFDAPGHLAVLVFFILSGYVIGINHKEKLSRQSILPYIKKRLVRIYPIYFLAILLSLFVSVTAYPWKTILANFTLTQNIFFPVIWENNPAWSINYEVLYYLLFIPISFFNIKPLNSLLIFLSIGFLSLYLSINPIVTAYSFGYCFWILGLYMAWDFKNSTTEIKVIPVLLYFLAIEKILSGTYILRLISIIKPPESGIGHFWSQKIIDTNELNFLPYCFMIVLFLAGKDFKYKKHFFIAIQAFILISIYAQFKHHTHNTNQFTVALIVLFFAALTHFIKIPEEFIKRICIKLGSLSYGIYMIHFPILMLFGKMTFLGTGPLSLIVKILLYLATVLLFSWILEAKLQPIFKNWLNRKSYPKSRSITQ